jgi:predicted permease
MWSSLRSVARRVGQRRRNDFERQLDDELRSHVEAEMEDLIRAGVAPEEAKRRAMATFGGFDRWREEARETRLGHRLEILGHDLKLVIRGLRHSPSYAVPALATIALGVAALATIATLAYAVLLRPLPYAEPSRLVAVYERNVPRKGDRNVVSAVAFLAWRQRSRTMDSVSGIMPDTRVWTTNDGAERVSGALVSPGFFTLLGVHPAIGGGFSGAPDAREVVVSHNFWSRRLGADRSIVGKTIRMDGAPVTLVGVMPPSFEAVRFGWLGDQDYWAPLTIGPQQFQWGRFLLVVARLHPGATLSAADREAHAIHAQLRSEGAIAEGWDTQVFALGEEIVGSVRGQVYALVVACSLLLVMVLTNTSLLTVAHARRRTAEYALRSVLGATRARLLGERAMRTIVIAGAAATIGLVIAAWTIPALTRFLPADVPRLDTVRFGASAVIVALGAAALTAIVLAVAPSIGHRSVDVAALHGGDRLTRGARMGWIVVAETAAAVVLTVFAALTLRSFDQLSSVNVGFDSRNLIAFRVAFNGLGMDSVTGPAAGRELLRQLRATPGVAAAARTSRRPLNAGGTATTITPEGWGDRDRSAFPTADVRWVDADYFGTLGIPLRSGRLFSTADNRDAPPRVIVNEALARKMWPNERSIIGKRFDVRLGGPLTREIVGVVGDARLQSPRREPRPTVYISTGQQDDGDQFDVLLRVSGDETPVFAAARRIVQSIAPSVPLYRVESMTTTIGKSIARERVTAQLLFFFAASALVLVAVGVYGLYAGEVSRRRREIGVRMALGATRRLVVQSLLGRALLRSAVGAGVGGVAGILAARVLDSTLYGVRSTDATSYAASVIVVVFVAIGATLLPALQAARVSPSYALRAD